jgi:hypothetical protein
VPTVCHSTRRVWGFGVAWEAGPPPKPPLLPLNAGTAEPFRVSPPEAVAYQLELELLKESRQPIAGTKTHPRRVDYEYERAGTASIFMFCEPLSGWRQVSVRARRTKVDWAQEVEELLRTRYASVEKVI